jgi:hypothetical protein
VRADTAMRPHIEADVWFAFSIEIKGSRIAIDGPVIVADGQHHQNALSGLEVCAVPFRVALHHPDDVRDAIQPQELFYCRRDQLGIGAKPVL